MSRSGRPPDSLPLYLQLGYLPAPFAMLRGSSALEPGARLGDDWFRLQPSFRTATATFHMGMRRFAGRSFIGEEEISEAAAFAKDDRHVICLASRVNSVIDEKAGVEVQMCVP